MHRVMFSYGYDPWLMIHGDFSHSSEMKVEEDVEFNRHSAGRIQVPFCGSHSTLHAHVALICPRVFTSRTASVLAAGVTSILYMAPPSKCADTMSCRGRPRRRPAGQNEAKLQGLQTARHVSQKYNMQLRWMWSADHFGCKCDQYLAHLAEFLAVIPAARLVSDGEEADGELNGLFDQELPRMVKQTLLLRSAVTQCQTAGGE